MTHLQIENLNKSIHYLEGKIYFEPNKGYTSDLLKKYTKLGYSCSTSGIMHYFRDNKNRVIASGYSWEGLLQNIAIALN
jgi:hypothetical protein